MIYLYVSFFALGVITAALYTPAYNFVFALLPMCAGVLFYGFLLWRRVPRQAKTVTFIALGGIFFLIGVVRYEMLITPEPALLEVFQYQFVEIEGQVARFPEEREMLERTILTDVSINGIFYPHMNILLWHDLGTGVSVKDTVLVEGVVTLPEDFETEQGRVFEYTEYLANSDVYLEMFRPHNMEVVPFEGLSLMKSLEKLKGGFLGRMEKVLPEPHSSLAGGILLGEKQSLGDLLQEQFRIVGLTHIVVLSGYNIAVVVVVILFLLSALPLLWSSLASIIGITLFALLVGGGATVVRASLMAGLLIVARLFHRPYDALRGLFIAGFVMALINPRIIVFDLSFQLSFLATLGIILFTPVAERWFFFVPKRLALREVVVTTFSAQLFVLPWIAYTIGDFSVVSFLANLLVLPAIPIAMLASFISGLLPLSFVSLPAFWLLGYVLYIAEVLSAVPYASVVVPQVNIIFVIMMYLLLVWVSVRYGKPRRAVGPAGSLVHM